MRFHPHRPPVLANCFGLLFSLVFTLAFGAMAAGWQGAPAPAKPPHPSPLNATEQLPTFSLPPGFKIELLASDPDINKVVAFNFSDDGKLWATTAMEYPVDGNENPEAAKALYARGGKDKVLVFDHPTADSPQKPRVFADGLAIPLAILATQDGVIVGEGPSIYLLQDTDGDGKADRRTILLTGFGIQDSHLMPHQLTRGPGGWIYVAQGAFNSSRVLTKEGKTVAFDQCKLGRFTPDGSRFEIVGWGLNNIWGLAIDRFGEFFIQEANDLGYPVVPFFVGASYPGIGMHKARPYSPWQPPLADFSMGGTGLSGLALCEPGMNFPAAAHDVMFVANPITSKIQAIRILRRGPQYALEKLADFVDSSDPWFRPIALQFGPDGCLYVLDWYNKIISHNEVPRNHPERDKFRSRIWRIRHGNPTGETMVEANPSDAALMRAIQSDQLWQSRSAWHGIIDRKLVRLAPALENVARSGANLPVRLRALWALEGLGKAAPQLLEALAGDANRALRRESVRIASRDPVPPDAALHLLELRVNDSDPQVRAELIRSLGERLARSDSDPGMADRFTALLVQLARAPLDGPTIKPQQGGEPTLTGEAADRAFERSLLRSALEASPSAVARVLDSEAGKRFPVESQILAILSLPAEEGAPRLAAATAEITRALNEEELLLLARHFTNAAVRPVLAGLLSAPATARHSLLTLEKVRARFNVEQIAPLTAPALRSLLQPDSGEADQRLFVRLAGVFHSTDLEGQIVKLAEGTNVDLQIDALKTLRDLGADRPDFFQRFALAGRNADSRQREAVLALASSRNDRALPLLLEVWPVLPSSLRKLALDRFAASPAAARRLLTTMEQGAIPREEIDDFLLEKLRTLLGDDPGVAALSRSLARPTAAVLRLAGGKEDYCQTELALQGAFTVETWIRLDPGIDHEDGILGRPGGADFNFAGGYFRVFAGPDAGDVIVARTRIQPEVWTHVAVTRSERGEFRLYLDGEPDVAKGKLFSGAMTGLDLGRTSPPSRGTGGRFSEFRVWNVERSPEQIHDWYQIALGNDNRPRELSACYSGEDWGRLHGGASVDRAGRAPGLHSLAEMKVLMDKFDNYRKLAQHGGQVAVGHGVFTRACSICHSAQGEGGNIGPTLNGAGAMGTEALLRSILTPSAAVESGYYRYRVQTSDDEIVEGFLASQDESGVVVRQPVTGDVRIARARMKSSGFTRASLMPEGILEGLSSDDVANLFAYLATLK